MRLTKMHPTRTHLTETHPTRMHLTEMHPTRTQLTETLLTKIQATTTNQADGKTDRNASNKKVHTPLLGKPLRDPYKDEWAKGKIILNIDGEDYCIP